MSKKSTNATASSTTSTCVLSQSRAGYLPTQHSLDPGATMRLTCFLATTAALFVALAQSARALDTAKQPLEAAVPDVAGAMLSKRTCGPKNGDCDKNGCNGVNDPTGLAGQCTAGDGIVGCPCNSICGAKNDDCNKNDCAGINDPAGGLGTCTGGKFKGCNCNSVCGSPGPCNKNGCAGVNSLGGDLGICMEGAFAGCTCASVCGNDQKSCDANGCAGVDGFCTAGDFICCPCGGACGNLQAGKCSENGCNGMVTEQDGLSFGICVGGTLDGCVCAP